MATAVQSYGSWADFTLTLASLASDTNLLAGRASTVVDLSGLSAQDVQIGGKITTGTSPTADRVIAVYAFADDTGDTTYPFGASGSDANLSITNSQMRDTMKLITRLGVSGTSNVTYWMDTIGIAQFFGGMLPKKLGLWVVHNTAVALNSTGSNHQISYRPVYTTIS